MNMLLPAVVLATGLLLTGCAGTPKMSVPESCAFLNQDTFVPTGNQQQKADQIAKHYQEVADKVAPEVAAPIQKMAEVMKQVAGTSLGATSAEQTKQLTEENNKIGQYCK
ncbi:hypothetical protein BJG92_00772 [Arthrobacter sp. SO5]|nr:hypothetical protein [Arthrobacter sp. SO5]